MDPKKTSMETVPARGVEKGEGAEKERNWGRGRTEKEEGKGELSPGESETEGERRGKMRRMLVLRTTSSYTPRGRCPLRYN